MLARRSHELLSLPRRAVGLGIVLLALSVLLFIQIRLGIEWKNVLLGLGICYGVILGIRRPVYALAFIIVLLPLKTLYARGELINLPKIAMAVPLMGFLAEISLSPRRLRFTRLEMPMALTALLIMLHYPSSYRPAAEVEAVWSLAVLFGLVIVIVNLLVNESSLKVGVSAWMLSAMVPAAAAYYQWFTGQPILGADPMFFRGIPRATGTFTSISGLGDFLGAYLVFGASLTLLSPSPLFRSKLVDWIIVLVCSAPLLLSLNKGGALGAMLGLLFLVYRLNRRRVLRRRAFIALLGCGAIMLFLLLHPAWQLRLFGLEGEAPPSSYEYRVNEARIIFDILSHRPFGGVGLGDYRLLAATSSQRLAQEPHSLLLIFIAAGGLFGLAVLVWIISVVAGTVRRSTVLNMERLSFTGAVVEAALITLVGYSVTFLTHGALGSDSHWILLGFLIAGGNICRTQKANIPEAGLTAFLWRNGINKLNRGK